MGEGKRVPGQEQDPLIRNESLLPPQAGILCAPWAKDTVGVRSQSVGGFTVGARLHCIASTKVDHVILEVATSVNLNMILSLYYFK